MSHVEISDSGRFLDVHVLNEVLNRCALRIEVTDSFESVNHRLSVAIAARLGLDGQSLLSGHELVTEHTAQSRVNLSDLGLDLVSTSNQGFELAELVAELSDVSEDCGGGGGGAVDFHCFTFYLFLFVD